MAEAVPHIYGPHWSVIEQEIEFRCYQYLAVSISTCPPPASFEERTNTLPSGVETMGACVLVWTSSCLFRFRFEHTALLSGFINIQLKSSYKFLINVIYLKKFDVIIVLGNFISSFFKTLRCESPYRGSKEQALSKAWLITILGGPVCLVCVNCSNDSWSQGIMEQLVSITLT